MSDTSVAILVFGSYVLCAGLIGSAIWDAIKAVLARLGYIKRYKFTATFYSNEFKTLTSDDAEKYHSALLEIQQVNEVDQTSLEIAAILKEVLRDNPA